MHDALMRCLLHRCTELAAELRCNNGNGAQRQPAAASGINGSGSSTRGTRGCREVSHIHVLGGGKSFNRAETTFDLIAPAFLHFPQMVEPWAERLANIRYPCGVWSSAGSKLTYSWHSVGLRVAYLPRPRGPSAAVRAPQGRSSARTRVSFRSRCAASLVSWVLEFHNSQSQWYAVTITCTSILHDVP